jgi:hypothetical protein
MKKHGIAETACIACNFNGYAVRDLITMTENKIILTAYTYKFIIPQQLSFTGQHSVRRSIGVDEQATHNLIWKCTYLVH